jgi:TonB family protein
MNSTHQTTATSEEAQRTVILKVRISKSGVVKDVSVVSGPPMLRAAAVHAVKRRKHKPPSWVSGSPRERQATLFVMLMKGAAPKIEEGIQAGVLGCVPAPSRVRVSQTVMETLLIRRVDPIYPPQAQTDRIEGIVVMRVSIDKGGSVYKADYLSGPSLLVPAASEAVKQWKYQPYLIVGEPVEVETTVDIRFSL